MTPVALAVTVGAILLLALLCALVSVLDPDLARMRAQDKMYESETIHSPQRRAQLRQRPDLRGKTHGQSQANGQGLFEEATED